jgi:hypothetical protein
MKRSASTTWNGGLRDGKGAVSTESRALKNYFYSFLARYDGKPGTNPGPDRTRTDLLGISMRCRQVVRTANPSDRKPTQILMVDDAVLIGPVSVSNSLLTGNLTGNFSNLGLFLRFSLLICEQIQSFADKFPTLWNREFFDRTGNYFCRTGNSWGRTEN